MGKTGANGTDPELEKGLAVRALGTTGGHTPHGPHAQNGPHAPRTRTDSCGIYSWHKGEVEWDVKMTVGRKVTQAIKL